MLLSATNIVKSVADNDFSKSYQPPILPCVITLFVKIPASPGVGTTGKDSKLEPFSLAEINEFLRKGKRETLLAAMALGGIPEYLKQLKNAASVYTGLCEKSFRPEEFFRKEKDRIFVSSLAANRYYEDLLDYLAHHSHATREQLYKGTEGSRKSAAGGSFTSALDDLVKVDFVEKYVPLTVKNPRRTRTAHFAIEDEYLHFFYRFIEHRTDAIDAGKFIANPTAAIPHAKFNKLMGHAFERWCRKNEVLIASHMRFAGVVEYSHGAWFEKSSEESNGFQIDLMFIRKDPKIIVCEVKYNLGTPVTRKIIYEVQTKLERFIERNPKYRRYTFETALITMEPVAQRLAKEAYFTYLITADELLELATRAEPRL